MLLEMRDYYSLQLQYKFRKDLLSKYSNGGHEQLNDKIALYRTICGSINECNISLY